MFRQPLLDADLVFLTLRANIFELPDCEAGGVQHLSTVAYELIDELISVVIMSAITKLGN